MKNKGDDVVLGISGVLGRTLFYLFVVLCYSSINEAGAVGNFLVKEFSSIDNKLTCGIAVGEEVQCEATRVITGRGAETTANPWPCAQPQDSCESFDTLPIAGSTKVNCYPTSHICNYNFDSADSKYEKVFDNPPATLTFRMRHKREYLYCTDNTIINQFVFGAPIIPPDPNLTVNPNSITAKNSAYYNFVKLPSDSSVTDNYLYKPLVITPEKAFDSTEDGYMICNTLTASSTTGTYQTIAGIVECDKARIPGISSCNNTISVSGVPNQPIETCDYASLDGMPSGTINCYPVNHICNKYGERGKFSKYFALDKYHFATGTVSLNESGNKFYIYIKNPKYENNLNKNCNFTMLSCDLNIKNESIAAHQKTTATLDVNVVYSNTADPDNLKFVKDVTGNLGEDSLFKYVGSCVRKNCNDNVMKAKHYFKYVDIPSSNATYSSGGQNAMVYYFKKDINHSTIGKVCNGYLPTCDQIAPSESFLQALYDDTASLSSSASSNNSAARQSFYAGFFPTVTLPEIRDEHLWFTNNGNFSNVTCLALRGTIPATLPPEESSRPSALTYNTGYCSDLNDTKTALKYPDGLVVGVGQIPNCYLKSCIDLTDEELTKVLAVGIHTNKYCSEYYYIENERGFKYFPKEKPTFCSELENVRDGSIDYGKQLKFRYREYSTDGTEIPKIEKFPVYGQSPNCTGTVGTQSYTCIPAGFKYFGYGGGLNSTKSNCYLKSCFSMDDDEREVVANSRIINITNELKRIDPTTKDSQTVGVINIANFDPANVNKYCENSFLLSSKFTPDFYDINLNIIPCYELHRRGFSPASGKTINFNQVILSGNYNTTVSGAICRTSYTPINATNTTAELLDYSIFNSVLSIGMEETLTYTPRQNISYLPANSPNYVRLDQSMANFSILCDNCKDYKNLCTNIDNNVLYFNTNSPFISSTEFGNYFNTDFMFYINSTIPSAMRNTFLSNYVFECNKYNSSLSDGDVNANLSFDCGIYLGADETTNVANQILHKMISTAGGTTVKNKINELCDVIRELNSIDDSGIKLDVSTLNTRKEIRSDEYNWFIKPILTAEILATLPSPQTISASQPPPLPININYRGCFTVAFNGDGYSCMIPTDESYYVHATSFSDPVVGEVYSSLIDKQDGKIVDNRKINVCARFPRGITKCGERAGVPTKDKCIEVGNNPSNLTRTGVTGTGDEKEIDTGNEIGSIRFQTIDYGNGMYLIREFKVGGSYGGFCSSDFAAPDNTLNNTDSSGNLTKFPRHPADATYKLYPENNIRVVDTSNADEYYVHEPSSLVVSNDVLNSLMNGGVVIDMAQYRIRQIIAKFVSYAPTAFSSPWCVSRYTAYQASILANEIFGTPIMDPIHITACMGDILWKAVYATVKNFEDKYIIPANSELYYPRDYVKNTNENPTIVNGVPKVVNTYEGRGFISRASIVNNDNYLYVYYPRSDNIEEDIKNKLLANIHTNASGGFNRYYNDDGVISASIIQKCKIDKLVGGQRSCLDSNYNGGPSLDFYPSCSYEFSYYYLNENGDRISECTQANLMQCLTIKQQDCLKSYGTNFIRPMTEFDGFSVLKDGPHLKHHKPCGSVLGLECTEHMGNFLSILGLDCDDLSGIMCASPMNNLEYVPTSIIPYTMNSLKDNELKIKNDCKFNDYGDPIGDLSKCRGIMYGNLFYTESQAVPVPLSTHPFFFYTLVTPKNTPEIFEPTFLLIGYYSFLNYSNASGTMSYGPLQEVFSIGNVYVDFFNPRLKYDYDYVNGASDPELFNQVSNLNDFVSEIGSDKVYSYPYQVQYRNLAAPDSTRTFMYILEKDYDLDAFGSFTPKVCLHRINFITVTTPTDDEEGQPNSCLTVETCTSSTPGCIPAQEGKCLTVIDSELECYPRNIPFIDNFIFKPDINISFGNPSINVYFKPEGMNNNINAILNDTTGSYILKEGNDTAIKEKASNKIQGYGLNFERSYCSQLYYNYYKLLHELKLENDKTVGKDLTLIESTKARVAKIETIVKKDCYEENGEESSVIINESSMRPLKVAGSSENVISMETAKVQKYSESYGGFNELCLKDSDIDKIHKLYGQQRGFNVEIPTVKVFKNTNSSRQRKTKCVLDASSLQRASCRVGSTAYTYCEEQEKSEAYCKRVFDTTTYNYVYVKSINCDTLAQSVANVGVNEDNYEQVMACYKGGFNYYGNIYDINGVAEPTCSCEVISNNTEIDENIFTRRKMTSREMGLCVDLRKPNVCPAVKYYDSERKYVDDELALGYTNAEKTVIVGNDPDKSKFFEQHEWRTEEKIGGILPAVFFTRELGHAEFPESVYCEADKTGKSADYYAQNCIGGSQFVYGECKGYWKWDTTRTKPFPVATCTETTQPGSNRVVYEYKLMDGLGCERYTCPNVIYSQNLALTNTRYGDERIIEENSADSFTRFENDSYSNVEITDFRSYTHDEETSADKADMRGASHGFASWIGTTASSIASINDDYAKIYTADKCLTGFGPSGSNQLIRAGMTPNNTLNIDYYDSNTFINSGSNFITLIQEQDQKVRNIIASTSPQPTYPVRRCNQKGEWMTVQDIYNLKLISQMVLSENFYYRNETNYWVKLFDGGIREWQTSKEKTDDDMPPLTNYCERLICPVITGPTTNIYNAEVLATANSDPNVVTKYTTWKHTGGAKWDETTAPRNSSVSINNTGIGTDLSKNITYIFSDQDSEDPSNKYNYLKKVRGICYTSGGYYERGTAFITEFVNQVGGLGGTDNVVDPRNSTLIDYSLSTNNPKSPTRVCTSTGLWGGVVDRCYRACEMMDIFHTTYSNRIVTGGTQITNSSGQAVRHYFNSPDILVENEDISLIAKNAGDQTARENKFVYFDLQTNHEVGAMAVGRGDYLTGGAAWPRTIVTEGNSVVETDNSSPKKGLKYTWIETNCDSSYLREDTIRQYVMVSPNVRPKRKCYEDGTWGPVVENTRCALSRNCRDFTFRLSDLLKLITIYNDDDKYISNSNPTVAKLYDMNVALSQTDITFNADKDIEAVEANCDTEHLNNCAIYKFDPSGTSLDIAINRSRKVSVSSAYIGDASTDPIDNISHPFICSTTSDTSSGGNTAISGWSLGNVDLGNYFIPNTCDRIVVGGNALNRITVTGSASAPHYPYESHLNLLYNALTPGYVYAPPFNSSHPNGLLANGIYIENEAQKTVKIGTKNYLSYQVSEVCKPDLFYNKVGCSNGSTASSCPVYEEDKIMLECRENKSGNTGLGTYSFQYNTSYVNLGVTTSLKTVIKADDCRPKTCGANLSDDELNTNPFHSNNWSSSYIKEVVDYATTYDINTTTPSTSTISCENGYAFVVPNNENVTGMVLSSYVNGGVDYGTTRKFFKSMGLTCTKDPRTPGSINGISSAGNAGITNYIMRKHGELDFGTESNRKLPKVFCKDIKKTANGCVELSEDHIMRNQNFNNSVQNGGYCVRMACSGKNLRFATINGVPTVTELDANGNLNPTASNSSNSAVFSLKKDTYSFGENVIIESVKDDFTVPNAVNAAAIISNAARTSDVTNYIYQQNSGNGAVDGARITGSICGKSNGIEMQDIYTDGVPGPFSFDKFVDTSPSNKIDDIYECFNDLENYSSIENKTTCSSGYTRVSSNICVKYGGPYGEKVNTVDNIRNALSSFKVTAEVNTQIRNNIITFLVNELFFDGSKKRVGAISDTRINNIIDDIINNAKTGARNSSETNFQLADGTACAYEGDTGDNVYRIATDADITSSANTIARAELNEYSEKSGNLIATIMATGNLHFNNQTRTFALKLNTSSGTLCTMRYRNVTREIETSGGIKKCKITETNDDGLPTRKTCMCFFSGTEVIGTVTNARKNGNSLESYGIILGSTYDIHGEGTPVDIVYEDEEVEEEVDEEVDEDGEGVGEEGGEVPAEEEVTEPVPPAVYDFEDEEDPENTCGGTVMLTMQSTESIPSHLVKNISIYNDKYDVDYESNMTTAKSTLRTNITNNSTDYDTLINKYRKIFIMEKFLNTGNNYTYYTDFLTYYSMTEQAEGNSGEKIGEAGVSKTEDGSYALSLGLNTVTTGTDETDDISPISYDNYSVSRRNKTNDLFDCSFIQAEGDSEIAQPCQRTIDPSKKEEVISLYQEYFIDFLTIAENGNVSNNHVNEQYNILISRLNGTCIPVYNDYFNKMNSYNSGNNSSSATFTSGLYLSMKCTPEGWVVYDSPSCKNTCSGSTSEYKIGGDFPMDKDWKGGYTYTRIRHTETFYTKFCAHQTASSTEGMTGGKTISTRCNNGVASTSASGKRAPSYNRWKCHCKWFFCQWCNSCVVSAEGKGVWNSETKDWKQTTYRNEIWTTGDGASIGYGRGNIDIWWRD